MRFLRINILLIIAVLIFSINSCSLLGINDCFDTGYIDEHKQYVPKKTNFKLKDLPNNEHIIDLDYDNIYKLVERYYDGEQNTFKKDSTLTNFISYKKFYRNGRCLSFGISIIDENGHMKKLSQNDLNPNNAGYSKCYYYVHDDRKITIESFVHGSGYGMYIFMDYFLNDIGDTLTLIYHKTKEIYIKEKIPNEWNNYKVDW